MKRCVVSLVLLAFSTGCQQTPVPSAAIPPDDPHYYARPQQQKPIDPAASGMQPGVQPGTGGNEPPPPPMPAPGSH